MNDRKDRRFRPVSLEEYIALHLKNNPSENRADLEERLKAALRDYHKGIKCRCGNDIWVIGSASVGNGCFTCITGESMPTDEYEIDSAMKKRENKKGRRHIDDMDPREIHGFFDDDGYEINVDLIPKPALCLTCVHDNDPHEELLCIMTRNGQREEDVFQCYSYRRIG